MVEEKKLHRLSQAQLRVLNTQKIYPDSTMYHIGGYMKTSGSIKPEIMVEALKRIINKKEAFRLRLCEKGYETYQYLGDNSAVQIPYIDFSVEKENAQKSFQNWMEMQSHHTFDLYESPLFTFMVFKLNEQCFGCYIRIHHIIADGWSIQLIASSLKEEYEAVLYQKERLEEKETFTFLDSIEKEQEYFSSSRYKRDEKYWLQNFETIPENSKAPSYDTKAVRKVSWLDAEISQKIQDFCKKNKLSVHAFFIAVYALYYKKMTGYQDFTIGVPILGRKSKKECKLIGMFVSSVPLRIRFQAKETVLDYLKRIQGQHNESMMHQQYPYNYLIHKLNLKTQGSQNLYSICVNNYNTNLNFDLDSVPAVYTESFNGEQEYSLQIISREWGESRKIELDVDYKVSEYSEEDIEQMLCRMKFIISQLIQDKEQLVLKITLLTEGELKQQIYDYNASDAAWKKDSTVLEMIGEQVKKNPDKTALVDDGRKLSYHQMDLLSNGLARSIKAEYPGKGNLIGLLSSPSIEAVLAILGILKSGNAYVPIDPENPKERINQIIKTAGIKLLFVQSRMSDIFMENVRYMDEMDWKEEDTAYDELESVASDSLAYVIFTSGSTGVPKGVMIEHHSLANYIRFAVKSYVSEESEVFPLYSSLAFDLTVTSVFTPLSSGGKILVYRNKDGLHPIQQIAADNLCTVVKLTPAHMVILEEGIQENTRIRKLILGGDILKKAAAQKVVRKSGGKIRIYNEYGPTEATVGCMIYEYDEKKDLENAVPVGKPADNLRIYLLDEERNPVILGQSGEIYIAGEGLARGYFNRQDLTEEKFTDDPFYPGERMYQTGDMGKFIRKDCLDCIGRMDRQHKIHGYRVELDEVEKVFDSMEMVTECVVDTFQESDGEEQLCAYYTASERIPTAQIKSYMKKILPYYMVPNYFVRLEEIPHTINGKVNRNLLVPPQTAQQEERVLPQTENETILAEVIEEYLGKSISMDQDFFECGGDSIKAIQIAGKLKQYRYNLGVKDILIHTVFKDMASCMRKQQEKLSMDEKCEGDIEFTPVISRFFGCGLKNENYYNQCFIVELKKEYKTEWIQDAWKKILDYHDMLRADYDRKNKKLFYNDSNKANQNPVQIVEIKEDGEREQDELRKIICRLNESINIEKGFLIKAGILIRKNGERKLVLAAHHLVIDGVSFRILLDDLEYLAEQQEQHKKLELPEKTLSFQKWSRYLMQQNEKAQAQYTYWKEQISREFQFPVHENEQNIYLLNTVRDKLCEQELAVSFQLAVQVLHCNLMEIVLYAWLKALSQYTGETSLSIEIESHGRNGFDQEEDVSRTVGWFTSIYPFSYQLSDSDFMTQIGELASEYKRIPDDGTAYGLLEQSNKITGLKNPVRFNYLGDFSDNGYRWMSITPEGFQLMTDTQNKTTAVLELNFYKIRNQLCFLVSFYEPLVKKEEAVKLLGYLKENLAEVCNGCSQKEYEENSSNDFDMVSLSQEEYDDLFE